MGHCLWYSAYIQILAQLVYVKNTLIFLFIIFYHHSQLLIFIVYRGLMKGIDNSFREILSYESHYPSMNGALFHRKLITLHIKQLSGFVCTSCKNDPHFLIRCVNQCDGINIVCRTKR